MSVNERRGKNKMATKVEIDRVRKKLRLQPISKTIAIFKKQEFVGKNKAFFVKLKADDNKLNRQIAKSIDKKRRKK